MKRRRIMKKVMNLLFVLVLLGSGLLAACGPQATPMPTEPPAATEPPAPEPTEAPAEKVTITFAGRAVSDSALEARDKALQDFAEKYPNIIVEREELPHADFWVKIPAEIAAGTGPDVIELPYLEQAVTFAAKGMLEPLDSYVDGPNGMDREDWLPEVLNYGVYGGKLMVLPMALMLTGLAYNKDMFDAAGVSYPTDDWTWDDMLDAAKKLTLDANGKNAEDPDFDPEAIVQWGIYTWWWNSDFDLYLWTFGGDWLNEDATECTLDSPQAIEAITFYGDLTQKYHVAPYIRELAPAHGHPAFMESKVAMAFIDIVNIALVDESGVNWDMAVIPYKKDVGTRVAFLFGDGVAVLKGSKNKEAAWELAKFMASHWDPELAKVGYGFPALKSAVKATETVEVSPKVKVLQKMYEAGWPHAIRATDYAGMVVEPCNTIMEGVLTKGAQPDYKALMEEANEQCNMALQDAPKLE
jgi:multiple sugar transport system substrate-binding protein